MCGGTRRFAFLPSGRGARVYPRVCGGTAAKVYRGRGHRSGVYPRVCGGTSIPSCKATHGSIPACAGAPTFPIPSDEAAVYPRVCGGTIAAQVGRERRRVYPRVCGGTHRTSATAPTRSGLSPRVRGHPDCPARHRGLSPRVRGHHMRCLRPPGLSPRVRGHLQTAAGYRPREGGSIPACAGAPPGSGKSRRRTGLSPRVRGHQSATPEDRRWRFPMGSIPACAGAPNGTTDVDASLMRVYPRVCGGTPACRYPRVGSIPACAGAPLLVIPACAGAPKALMASIPACAGAPRLPGPGSRGHRTRGGLSPRVRGHLLWWSRWPFYPRVCGGTVQRFQRSSGVYPRVCGGTGRAFDLMKGSIPACAGAPLPVMAIAWGAIPACAGAPFSCAGGSIPACAGAPLRRYGTGEIHSNQYIKERGRQQACVLSIRQGRVYGSGTVPSGCRYSSVGSSGSGDGSSWAANACSSSMSWAAVRPRTVSHRPS